MKKLLSILCLTLAFTFAQAQTETESKTDSKVSETTFKVNGVCGMCKDRIEAAAMRTSGVKMADWDKKTQMLKVVYKSNKTTDEEIQKSVANVGHETETMPADSTSYAKLPDCCRYKEGAVCGSEKKH
jgi:copper chaperone CopZ